MLVKERRPKSKTSSRNHVIKSSRTSDEVDPNLYLRENITESKHHNKSYIKINKKSTNIKKQLSIELLNEILKNPDISIQEKEYYESLIDKINEKKYYYCYADPYKEKSEIIRFFERTERNVEKPLLFSLPDILDYDVELYKLGKMCNGLKKRYAIIKRGGFFSSKKPLSEMVESDKTKIKDKTMYLEGSRVLIETKNDPYRSRGEWSNHNKIYRIRINYPLEMFEKNPKHKESSFFLYFDDPKKMKEVELMLFGFSLTSKQKKMVKRNIANIDTMLTHGNLLYTIMKIMSVKNKIKKRKIIFKKVDNAINGQISGKLNIEKRLLVRLSLQRKETKRLKLLKKNTLPKIIENVYEKQYSDFMPLISNFSPDNHNKSYKKEKRALNDLIIKYRSLKDEIPQNIINENNNELTDKDICFVIPKGPQIKKPDVDYNPYNLFNLEPSLWRNVKYIYFNKNKPEIIFKNNNNDILNDYNDKQTILSGNNIYEISNVVLNSNLSLNSLEENNLVIIGPKTDNNIGINYKYRNNYNAYTDPENVLIKNKTVNKINSEEINGTTIQIIQGVLDINNQKIKSLLQDLDMSVQHEINFDNLKDSLLFGYRIKLSELKNINSVYNHPKENKNNIYFVQFNQQYFIPNEYFNDNSNIIIECFCLLVDDNNWLNNNIPRNKKEYLIKFLSPVSIGYIEINKNNIEDGKYAYEIKNNDIADPNSYFIIDGGKDTKESMNINNIEGKDYSVGHDSYIEKKINKLFINKAKNNPKIPENIKNKYFNVCFDNDIDNQFLFRPNESMDENEFIRDISSQISNEEMQKIRNNKKYNYLPYCEKYIDEKTLYESQNLKCLSEAQKKYIVENYREGEWIYKMPEIKVKLLSKNLGVKKSKYELSQFIYSTDDIQSFPIDSLTKGGENKVILISENNFNIFDMKEMHNMENFEKFQWKIGIKFNNRLQMESFLKLLILARQNINAKKKQERIGNNDFDFQKLFDFDNKKKTDDFDEENQDNFGIGRTCNKCEINIEFIDFREDFQINIDPTLLEIIVRIEGHVEKSIISLLKDKQYGFENSLLTENDRIRNAFYNKNNNDQGKKEKKENFPKRVKLSKQKFNNGQKKIILGDHLKTQFNFIRNINNDYAYSILIILDGTGEFYSLVDINQIINSKKCNKYELPIYKIGENSKIFGCLGIDLYELDNSGQSFQERFEELNNKYLKEPLQVLKEKVNLDIQNFQNENYHFGLYEPNVFRRKILNFIHNDQDFNVDPTDMDNSLYGDLDLLYRKLIKKCVILPKRDNFSMFKFYNIRKNYDINQIKENSYRRKLGLKLLKIQRHEKFLEIFRKKEWDLYLYQLNKLNNNLKGIDYFMSISNKKILLYNKDDANKFHTLIYTGIPSPEYRKVIYTTLLEINNLYQKTREILYKKYQRDYNTQQRAFNFFSDQLFENDNKTNLIFSLIDNDSTFISSLGNIPLEDIKIIKKIAKSFFIWADLGIGLTKKEDKYVYFIGLLSIIQKLRQYFQEDYFVFWLLTGLSQYITHFHQQNPLFTDEMNYINIYGLVTKLILENHQKKIYDRFIALNFPLEFFLSRHLSTLYTDYFKDELMMRIFDILIFESSFQGLYGDKLQYLRILCAIPITLFELSKNRILVCKTVSEIESIFNDLILHTFNYNKFIFTLEKNVNKFYVISSFLEKWFFNNRGREWDAKRDELQNLIYQHFSSIYKENTNYLHPISLYLNKSSQEMYNYYFENLDNNLGNIKNLFGQGTANYDNSNTITGVMVQISKLQQIFNNDTSYIEEYKLILSFGETSSEIGNNYKKLEVRLSFDNEKNIIKNIQDLLFKEQFIADKFPKYIHIALTDNQYNVIASFAYKILSFEPMKISKITVENKEEKRKYFLEFVLFKYTTKTLPSEEIALFNIIFSSPQYLHSKPIEEKLYSYSISNNSFNKNISQLIKWQNDNLNAMVSGNIFDANLIDMYKKLNNTEENQDKYNTDIINNLKSYNPFKSKAIQNILKILGSYFQGNIQTIINKWLTNSSLSIEELLYSIILIDKSLISINEKLFLLYSIAQTKDKLLFNNDELSIDKLKEMIYSLYKRYMIYFTKTDVERMIDFLLKDERLFNIKYAFVYNKNDTEKINEFIYDKDNYEPKLGNKKLFEIFFDDINKEINIYLSHLNNHYNMNCLSKDIFIYILTRILNKIDLTKYIQYKFDTITIVIEKDNMIFKRNYNIKYSPLKITQEYDPLFDVKAKNPEDIPNCVLCYEISNFDTTNMFSTNNYISFDKFKEIFFKLPYLSDLFRVSFTYISENKNTFYKEFDNLKVIIGYEDYYHGIFYFPRRIEDEDDNNQDDYEGNIGYEMNTKIKIFDTIDYIINEIIKKVNNKIRMNNNEIIIRDYLKSIDKINCYVCYYIDEYRKQGIIKEKIGYFDSLYSCMALKNKNIVEIQIIFNNDLLTFNSSHRLVQRGKGYCKIFYSNNNDFIWRKCNVKSKDISNAKLTSTDYKTIPTILNRNEDVVLAFNI